MIGIDQNIAASNAARPYAEARDSLRGAQATESGSLQAVDMDALRAISERQHDAIPPTVPSTMLASTRQPSSARVTDRKRFLLEHAADIDVDFVSSWLIKGLLPSQGLVAVHGKPGVGKSFIALDMAVAIAHGDDEWGGRRVHRASVVYVAAEGASGLRKRIVGAWRRRGLRRSDVDLHLISQTPNFGTAQNDVEALLSEIEAAGCSPGLVIIDTLAATLGSADENGPGMTQFVACVNEIASRLKCCVLIVHHQPHGEDRLRGHSSLQGAMDGIIAVAPGKEPLTVIVSVTKAKDDATGSALKAEFSREVLLFDADGDEISTLVIASVTPTSETALKGKGAGKVLPVNSKLLMDVIHSALDEAGQWFVPEQGLAKIKGVADDVVRPAYYARIAERAAPGEDEERLRARQRKEFNRAVKTLLDRKLIEAQSKNDQRFLCLPSPASGGTRDTPKGVCPGMSRSPIAKGSGQSGTKSRNVPPVLHAPLNLELIPGQGQDGTKRDIATGVPPAGSDCADSAGATVTPSLECQPASGGDVISDPLSDAAVAYPTTAEAGEPEWAFDEPASEFSEPADYELPPLSSADIPATADREDGRHPDIDENGEVWL
jgi:KaiC/GvpD/RAD55 family RecA-like ATPase